MAVKVAVEWSGECHSVTLTDEQWAMIVAGVPLIVDGPGYAHEGELFQDVWDFAGGVDGDFEVTYGDGGVGWTGSIAGAEITDVSA